MNAGRLKKKKLGKGKVEEHMPIPVQNFVCQVFLEWILAGYEFL